jgi:hypothetical protein
MQPHPAGPYESRLQNEDQDPSAEQDSVHVKQRWPRDLRMDQIVIDRKAEPVNHSARHEQCHYEVERTAEAGPFRGARWRASENGCCRCQYRNSPASCGASISNSRHTPPCLRHCDATGGAAASDGGQRYDEAVRAWWHRLGTVSVRHLGCLPIRWIYWFTTSSPNTLSA